MAFSRRDFLSSAAIGAVSLGLEGQEPNKPNSSKPETPAAPGKRPIIVSRWQRF